MRKLVLASLCFISICSLSQSKVDSLSSQEAEIKFQIQQLEDSLKIAREILNQIEKTKRLEIGRELMATSSFSDSTILKFYHNIHKYPDSGEILFNLSENTWIRVIDYHWTPSRFERKWVVLYNGEVGYVTLFDGGFKPTEKMKAYAQVVNEVRGAELRKKLEQIEKLNEEELEKERLARERRRAERRVEAERRKKARKENLEKSYGITNANRILGGQIWIGMTSAMARESLGRPSDVNRLVFSWGVKEQWVYERGAYNRVYLYFDDGVLTSWQD